MGKEGQNDFLLILKAVVLFCLIAMFLASCGSPEKGEKGKISADEVLRKGGEALELSRDYLTQEKQTFIRDSEARLDSLRRKIDRMKKSLSSADTAAAGLRSQIQDLENKERLLEEKLEQLKAPDVWENLKKGMESAIDDLEKTQKNLSKQFE
jgi:hypothetical protein